MALSVTVVSRPRFFLCCLLPRHDATGSARHNRTLSSEARVRRQFAVAARTSPENAQASSSSATALPLIRALSTFDGLKTMTRRSVIGTSIPVLGFRPIRSDLERTKNRPNEDNLTDSPPIKASASSSNTDCTKIPELVARETDTTVHGFREIDTRNSPWGGPPGTIAPVFRRR